MHSNWIFHQQGSIGLRTPSQVLRATYKVPSGAKKPEAGGLHASTQNNAHFTLNTRFQDIIQTQRNKFNFFLQQQQSNQQHQLRNLIKLQQHEQPAYTITNSPDRKIYQTLSSQTYDDPYFMSEPLSGSEQSSENEQNNTTKILNNFSIEQSKKNNNVFNQYSSNRTFDIRAEQFLNKELTISSAGDTMLVTHPVTKFANSTELTDKGNHNSNSIRFHPIPVRNIQKTSTKPYNSNNTPTSSINQAFPTNPAGFINDHQEKHYNNGVIINNKGTSFKQDTVPSTQYQTTIFDPLSLVDTYSPGSDTNTQQFSDNEHQQITSESPLWAKVTFPQEINTPIIIAEVDRKGSKNIVNDHSETTPSSFPNYELQSIDSQINHNDQIAISQQLPTFPYFKQSKIKTSFHDTDDPEKLEKPISTENHSIQTMHDDMHKAGDQWSYEQHKADDRDYNRTSEFLVNNESTYDQNPISYSVSVEAAKEQNSEQLNKDAIGNEQDCNNDTNAIKTNHMPIDGAGSTTAGINQKKNPLVTPDFNFSAVYWNTTNNVTSQPALPHILPYFLNSNGITDFKSTQHAVTHHTQNTHQISFYPFNGNSKLEPKVTMQQEPDRLDILHSKICTCSNNNELNLVLSKEKYIIIRSIIEKLPKLDQFPFQDLLNMFSKLYDNSENFIQNSAQIENNSNKTESTFKSMVFITKRNHSHQHPQLVQHNISDQSVQQTFSLPEIEFEVPHRETDSFETSTDRTKFDTFTETTTLRKSSSTSLLEQDPVPAIDPMKFIQYLEEKYPKSVLQHPSDDFFTGGQNENIMYLHSSTDNDSKPVIGNFVNDTSLMIGLTAGIPASRDDSKVVKQLPEQTNDQSDNTESTFFKLEVSSSRPLIQDDETNINNKKINNFGITQQRVLGIPLQEKNSAAETYLFGPLNPSAAKFGVLLTDDQEKAQHIFPPDQVSRNVYSNAAIVTSHPFIYKAPQFSYLPPHRSNKQGYNYSLPKLTFNLPTFTYR